MFIKIHVFHVPFRFDSFGLFFPCWRFHKGRGKLLGRSTTSPECEKLHPRIPYPSPISNQWQRLSKCFFLMLPYEFEHDKNSWQTAKQCPILQKWQIDFRSAATFLQLWMHSYTIFGGTHLGMPTPFFDHFHSTPFGGSQNRLYTMLYMWWA